MLDFFSVYVLEVNPQKGGMRFINWSASDFSPKSGGYSLAWLRFLPLINPDISFRKKANERLGLNPQKHEKDYHWPRA
jgi:hypothetical protein